MHVCVGMGVHVSVGMCVHVCVGMGVHVCACAWMCAYVCACVCVCVYSHVGGLQKKCLRLTGTSSRWSQAMMKR